MVLIFDKTGSKDRTASRDALSELLTERGVDKLHWPAGSDRLGGADVLVLAHSTDLSDSVEEKLNAGAARGATIVQYSGGCQEETKKALGSGYVLTMSWNTLTDNIKRLPRSFTSADFVAGFDTILKRHLLHCFVILNWCASFPSTDFQVTEAQKEWQSSPAKWREIFSGCERDDLLVACGGSSGRTLPADMSAVQAAVDWLWPLQGNPVPVPAFLEVLRQIRNRFGISI